MDTGTEDEVEQKTQPVDTVPPVKKEQPASTDEKPKEQTAKLNEKPNEQPASTDEKPKIPLPSKKRRLTDFPCCIIFAIFIAAEIFIASFSFYNGDPKIFFLTKDSNGETCNTGNQTGKPYLFYFDLSSCYKSGFLGIDCNEPKICLSECPTADWSWNNPDNSSADSLERIICKPGVYPTEENLQDLIERRMCTAYQLASIALFNRCLPKGIFLTKNNDTEIIVNAEGYEVRNVSNETITWGDLRQGDYILNKFVASNSTVRLVLDDLRNTWFYIIMLIMLGVFLTLLSCMLMKFISGVVMVSSIIISLLALAGVMGFSIYVFVNLKDSKPTIIDEISDIPGRSYLRDKWLWLFIAIICAAIFLLILGLFLFFRRQLKFTIHLFGEGSKAMSQNISTLFFPWITFLLQLLSIILCATVSLYILAYTWMIFGRAYFLVAPGDQTTVITVNLMDSSQTEETYYVQDNNYTALNCSGSSADLDEIACHFTKGTGKIWTYILHGLNVFICLWILFFFDGFQQIAISGAFGRWCFHGKDKKHNLLWGCKIALIYHLGTIAHASFILALIRFIRLLIELIQKRVSVDQNSCAKFCLKITQCCCGCLESIIRFLTRQCYVITGIKGLGFCQSVKYLNNIFRDPMQFLINSITGWIMFLHRIMVTLVVGIIAYFIFRLDLPVVGSDVKMPLNYFYVPLIITILVTFIIIVLFFDVFEIAVDSVYISTLIGMAENVDPKGGNIKKLIDTKKKEIDVEPSRCCC